MSTTTASIDGARIALLAQRFESVVRAMMNTLVRTGRSGVLNTARDFSCCVLTADHELLCAAESLPIHVMSGPDLMARSIFDAHDDVAEGDAFLHNSPYHGNSHAADHCAIVPVFDGEGRHRFTVLAKAHQADCGNAEPTTYAAAARDVYAEGALIMPGVRVQRGYEDCADILRMLELRIRVPEQWRGDYLAMLGAARTGEKHIREMADELGWDRLEAYAAGWFDYSEQRMADAIVGLPEGRTTVTSAHDPFPGVPEGVPVTATIEVRHDPARIEIDLRDNIDCVPCGLNLSEATAKTAAMIGVFNSLHRDIPPNAGSFRRLDVKLRTGSVVGRAEHPVSTSVATTNVADRTANPIQRGFADLADGFGMAEVGLIQPPAMSVVSGRDARHGGEPFVNQIFLAVTGGAAGPRSDAWLNVLHVGNAGMMLRDSVEIDELKHPIRVLAQRIIPDSEGAGRFRGAPGGYAEFAPVGGPIEVMYLSDGTVHPALGARGGGAGARARQFRREADGSLSILDPCARVTLSEGESIVSESCGGGGYGDPRSRDPERVAHDVREGWVTRERAADVYAVVVDDDGQVDEQRTAELRAG
jgi:N-methylhydantoinase B